MAVLRFKEQSQRAGLALTLGAATVYVIAFIPLYALLGEAVVALVAAPVILTACSMGMRVGLGAAVLSLPLNTLFLNLTAGHGWNVLEQPGGVVPYVIFFLTVGVVGWLSDSCRLLDAERRAFQREFNENRRMSWALLESEGRYRTLGDISPEMVAIQSEGRYVYINPAGATLLGATLPEEIVGRSVEDFIHPDYRVRVRRHLQQVQEVGERAKLVHSKGIRLDGREIDVEVTAAPIAYNGKQATQIIVGDVTERTHIEENLRQVQKL